MKYAAVTMVALALVACAEAQPGDTELDFDGNGAGFAGTPAIDADAAHDPELAGAAAPEPMPTPAGAPAPEPTPAGAPAPTPAGAGGTGGTGGSGGSAVAGSGAAGAAGAAGAKAGIAWEDPDGSGFCRLVDGPLGLGYTSLLVGCGVNSIRALNSRAFGSTNLWWKAADTGTGETYCYGGKMPRPCVSGASCWVVKEGTDTVFRGVCK